MVEDPSYCRDHLDWFPRLAPLLLLPSSIDNDIQLLCLVGLPGVVEGYIGDFKAEYGALHPSVCTCFQLQVYMATLSFLLSR